MKFIDQWFFPHDEKEDHFKGLDGLRGVAVLIVLLSHASNDGLFFHEYLNFQQIGRVGVYLFFVLSAYLLDRQIAIAFLSNKSSGLYWKNYFLRRTLRIYPLFTIALIYHGGLTLMGLPTVIDKFSDIPLHLMLVKGESIFWSIPVEFKYYFVSPALLWIFHRYFQWKILNIFIAILTVIMATIVFQVIFPGPFTTLKYLPIFLTGTFISIYELLKSESFKKKQNSYIFDLPGIAAIILILLTIPFYFQLLFPYPVNFHKSIFFLPYSILWGIVLIAAKYGNGIIKKIMEIRPLRFIGTISFSLYLFHMPILKFVQDLPIQEFYKIYLFLLISVLISSISYLLIERPLSKVKIFHKTLSEKEIKKGKREIVEEPISSVV